VCATPTPDVTLKTTFAERFAAIHSSLCLLSVAGSDHRHMSMIDALKNKFG